MAVVHTQVPQTTGHACRTVAPRIVELQSVDENAVHSASSNTPLQWGSVVVVSVRVDVYVAVMVVTVVVVIVAVVAVAVVVVVDVQWSHSSGQDALTASP